MRSTHIDIRGRRGVTLVEFIGALVIGLPVVVSMLYAALEANYLFSIRSNLDIASRYAARNLAVSYAKTGSTADTVTPTIKIGHFVDPAAGQWSAPSFDLTTHPYTVTITCSYPTKGYAPAGMMPFPWPDPLGLGSSFSVRATATFPIAGG